MIVPGARCPPLSSSAGRVPDQLGTPLAGHRGQPVEHPCLEWRPAAELSGGETDPDYDSLFMRRRRGTLGGIAALMMPNMALIHSALGGQSSHRMPGEQVALKVSRKPLCCS